MKEQHISMASSQSARKIEQFQYSAGMPQTVARENWRARLSSASVEHGAGDGLVVGPLLRKRLASAIEAALTHTHSISVLFLHISQAESSLGQAVIAPLPAGLLQQVLVNAKRVIRPGDLIVEEAEASAAIIFAGVNRQEAENILERVYHSINLLQGETVVPPLTRRTTILLRIDSYPVPAGSIAELCRLTQKDALYIVLHPAILRRAQEQEEDTLDEPIWHADRQETSYRSVPFIKLPQQLSRRLKLLIPYEMACELHCVPVGRNQRGVTVAMAEPQNQDSVRRLQEVTGMQIFAVSCEEQELEALLARRW